MIKRYAEWLTKHSIVVLVLALSAVAFATSGLRFLSFKNDYRMFFSSENPQLLAFEALQKSYTKSDNILFVIAPKDKNVFSKEVLALIEDLTAKTWKLPYTRRVDSLTNFQYSRADGDNLEVNDLVRRAKHLSAEQISQVRSIALKEPLLLNRLISANSEVAGVNVTMQFPEFETGKEVPMAAGAAREMAKQIIEAYPGVEIHLTGGVMMNNAFPEASELDMKTLIPLMFVVIIGCVGLFLRAWGASVATFLVLACSVISSLGIAGWLGIQLSPTSIAAPNIILILVVAFSVHIIVSFTDNQRSGKLRPAALIDSIKDNCGPIFVSAFTTSVGFLSMNTAEAPPFRDLGNITAFGLFISFLLAFTMLPALLMLLPMPVRATTSGTTRSLMQLSELVIKHRKPFFWSMLTLAVGLFCCIPLNVLNDEFVKYFSNRMEFRRDTDFTNENLTGIYFIDYSLDTKITDGISNPVFLKEVSKFAEWYRLQPEVMHVHSLTDIIKRVNQNMHADAPEFYSIPENKELAAQYLLLYEMSLPYGLDLNDRITADKSATRMSVTIKSISSAEVLALEERAQEWLAQSGLKSVEMLGTSPTIMFAHIGQRNIKSMFYGEFLALGVIFVCMVVAFRSIKVGLLCMVPNIVPAGMAFGVWGLFVGQVGLALSVVAVMTIGIVVDDTIHFIWKYEKAKRKLNLSAEDSVRYAFSKVGTSIWMITFMFVAGFSILAFSAFEVNAGMGLLTAIVISFACVAELLFLPALLINLEEKTDESAFEATNCTVPTTYSSAS